MNMHDDFPAPVYVPGHYRIDDGLEHEQASAPAALLCLLLVGAAVFVLCAVL